MEEGLRDRIIVGFDLDGTLYNSTPEMDDLVRNRISERILEKMPEFETVERARREFNRRYGKLQSGKGVLESVGYEDCSKVMDDCLATANVAGLIEEDPALVGILEKLKEKRRIYLLTSSPESMALEKLNKLGIDPELFDVLAFNDTPRVGSKSEGDAFLYVMKKIGVGGNHHVYIGDRLRPDISPANKWGMKTVAVWSEIQEADYSIDHIHDIERLLL
jgi:FMN phosphatase YigB (HAD superfamily)